MTLKVTMPRLKIKLFLPLLALLLVYFATRLQHLQSIPIFGDEAIYLRWSQLIKNVDTLRFVPLSDGKEPLFMWFTAVAYKFIADPLVAGRLLSVISGALIITTLYVFSLLFFNFSIAIISTVVYLFLPFSFFFDRLALADNLLSFFGVLSLLFAFLLAKHPRLDLSLILGAVLGLAWLTKSPAIYFVVLSLVTFLLYRPKNYKKIYFPLISGIIAFIIYNILRLGPQFSQIAIRNLDYIWPVTEIIKHPLDPLVPHLWDIVHIYSQYISLPLIILSLLGLLLSKKNPLDKHHHCLIALWWILPLIANATMAKVFTARYILFTLPPLVLLMAVGIHYFFTKTLKYFKYSILQIIILLICLSLNIFWIYKISFNPFSANLPSTETGYLSGWTSGWGIKAASQYLIARSKVANVIVGTEGYFGTLPDGLQIYTDSLKQLTVFGVGIDLVNVPDKLIDARNHGDEVYLLINQSRLKLTPEQQNKVTLVDRYAKPGNDYLLLYRLN
jgi:4-amino-4-deoxy-L-arabinose transferase-like glycosyltransferase